jgi:uncharacterized protein (DUF433 family)
VHSDPELMGGALVFRGSRVPAQTLLDYLDDGFSMEEFLLMFPSVGPEDAVGFLNLARGPSDKNHPGREPSEETAYLMRSPTNAKRLLEAIDALESGKGIARDID